MRDCALDYVGQNFHIGVSVRAEALAGGDADTMSVYAETDINAGANGITAFIIEKGFRSFATSPQRSRMHAGTRQAISTSKRSR